MTMALIRIDWKVLIVILLMLVVIYYMRQSFGTAKPQDISFPHRQYREYKPNKELTLHPVLPLPKLVPSSRCEKNGLAWDCVGGDRDWGVVFVDHRPGERRSPDVVRMLARSLIVVVHDTEQPTYDWPHNWAGRRSYTEMTRDVGTTIIQGDLDKDGKIFDQIVDSIKKKSELSVEKEKISNEMNPEKSEYGTHIKLLAVAATLSGGDMLEMGTGLFSTPELHRIAKEDKGGRMVVSADTDILWLKKFMGDFSDDYHQFLLVPAYSDLVGCYDSLVHKVDISDEDRKILRNPDMGKDFSQLTCLS